MAKGTTIEKLFLSLGLDMTALDADMLTASKTVQQGMSDLKTKSAQSKLRMEIDMSQFKGAENSSEALAAKSKHLTDQLAIQKQQVQLLNATYQESVKNKGADDAVSQRILTRLLREQRAEADLAAQIKQTNAARNNIKTGNTTTIPPLPPVPAGTAGPINSVADAYNRVRTASGDAGTKIIALNTKMIALSALAATGFGMFSFVKGVVDAGDAIYKLSVRMNLTTTEAAGLNRMLGNAGVDSQAFISTMTRLDRQILSAGKNGNSLTDSIQTFGFSLTDANGSLLPMNQQLEQLALGYKNAALAGNEEAFSAEVLGQKGQALIPILAEYAEQKEILSRTKTFGGIDPEEAHKAALEFKILNAEAGQFKNVIGVALFPIVKEFIPYFVDGMGTAVAALKDNKESIVETATSVGELVSAVGELAKVTVIPVLGWIIDNKGTIVKAFEDISDKIRVITEHPFISAIEAVNPFSNQDMVNPYINQYKAERESRKQAAEDRRKDIADQRKIDDEARKNKENNEKKIQQATANALATKKANKKAIAELESETYKATHSAFENEIRDLEEKKKKMIDDGVAETTAMEIFEARKKIIIDKNNKEIQKSSEELSDKLYQLTHSSTENRLQDIEKERKEWIKKTGDEVKASQLAEAQKLKLAQEQQQKRDDLNSKILKLKDSPLQSSMLDLQSETRNLLKSENDKQQVILYASLQRKKILDDAEKDIAQKRKDALLEYEEAFKQSQEKIKSYLSGTYGNEISAIKKGLLAGQSEGQMESMLARMAEERKKDEEANSRATEMVRRNVSVPTFDDGGDNYKKKMDGINNQERDLKLASKFTLTDLDASKITVPIVNAINGKDTNFEAYIKSQYADLKPANLDYSGLGANNMTDSAGLTKLAQAIASVNNSTNNNNNSKTITNAITVSVELNATVNNEVDVNILTDKVADKITPPIVKALGGDEYGY